MATTMRMVGLPVGSRPGWELQDEEMNARNGEWHNVADRRVLSKPLKAILTHSRSAVLSYCSHSGNVNVLGKRFCAQIPMMHYTARERWLTSAFPKFSGRARGSKHPEVKPTAHSIKLHQKKFEFSVGPHIFSNTRLYEIHYLPQQPATVTEVSSMSEPATGSVMHCSSVSPTSYSGTTPTPQGRVNEFVTPALLEQVTQAASADPALHHLLQLAQKNQLTEAQRTTLAAFVRSLNEQLDPRHADQERPQLASSSEAMAVAPPVRLFDLVIEFQEKPSDRWLVPRGAVCLADTTMSLSQSTCQSPGSILSRK
ncbi:hypothetical protein BC835DRAFT_1305166 [Cytidiella melzeri]|nr:hypothetical protein BC835DRAFT_1305166 [Cytidiella melzeri]